MGGGYSWIPTLCGASLEDGMIATLKRKSQAVLHLENPVHGPYDRSAAGAQRVAANPPSLIRDHVPRAGSRCAGGEPGNG
jgi:hypothetical protein